MKNIDRWRNSKNVTHLLLDGGTLSAKEGFYEAYVRDLLNEEKLYVVEKKTSPHFRFFVDLDYVGEAELDFERVCKEICEIVKLGSCMIAKAGPRKSEKGGTKYGVHMIWNESVVDKRIANSIRLKILDEFGPDWEKIIDASVYGGSGLRMIWSYKNEPGSTQYVPWARIEEDGQFKIFENVFPNLEFLKLFSIRTNSTETPLFSKKEDESCTELEKFIRMNIPGQERARILKISKCKKSERGLWVSTNSRYCDNIKREHKSNHVWFIVKPGKDWHTIAQKCQDEECKGYTGRFYRFPSRLIPNDEGVLDTRSHRTIFDYIPDGWRK
jgi:hypothetical protein